MRVYIINGDQVTVARQHPSKLSKGEIAVASVEELRAARLTGKRLVALWNGLPGPETLTKIGDRQRLLDRLRARMEALPDPKPRAGAGRGPTKAAASRDQKPRSKQATVISMLCRAKGATVDEVMTATGWQRHTVRGMVSAALKKKLGLSVTSTKEKRGRVYRIIERPSSSSKE
jgi:hypothetical protein